MVQQQLRLIKSLDLVGQDIIVLLEQELLKSVLQENTTMLWWLLLQVIVKSVYQENIVLELRIKHQMVIEILDIIVQEEILLQLLLLLVWQESTVQPVHRWTLNVQQEHTLVLLN